MFQCGEINCKRTCASEELFCVVLDDNGYVIVSDTATDTGRFFGEIRADIMNLLVIEGIYKTTRMYDYQATCFESRDSGNFATKLPTVSATLYHYINTTNTILAISKYN